MIESSEDSEDEVEDSMNSGDFCFVAGTTVFFIGTVVGSGSSGTVADTSDTDSSLGTRWRTGDVPLSSRCVAATAAARRSLGEVARGGRAL